MVRYLPRFHMYDRRKNMPSIALFCSIFTNEDEIKQELSSALGLNIINDQNIISAACKKHPVNPTKLEQALYNNTSVFNHFTLERERNVSYIKEALADSLEKQNCIYDGFVSLLVPDEITHVMKILIIDSKDQRIKKAVATGYSEKEAVKLIKKSDQSAMGWSDFLFRKDAFDTSLYDIVIPVGKSTMEEIVQLIKENFAKPALIKNDNSTRAIRDFTISVRIEQALLTKGYRIDHEVKDGHVTFLINKNTLNFTKLANALSLIAGAIEGVQKVEVKKGKDYRTSIYRDQNFELPPKVLLVDDEREFVQTLSERLVSRNVGSYAVYDGQQALDFIQEDNPDVMILDLKMPGIDGIEVLKQTKKSNPKIEVIILTGHGTLNDEKTCMELGAFAYLRKPADIEKLSATINDAYRKIAENDINPPGDNYLEAGR